MREFITCYQRDSKMTKKDIRKEQVALLRFEKQLAGLAATLAAGGAVAKAADAKLNASEGSEPMLKCSLHWCTSLRQPRGHMR